ncbi:hypothetical protein L1987_37796 [Smallanthus sonchifolius]|uniref:Uncharacterized protein n=1 Tax=Smallanthus sonchifolius TaxID=185202 RepID=A0ACB9HI87_9ASTR|nr:hypothetical protein L1987_37796 [Smallanthus sonchifolius]
MIYPKRADCFTSRFLHHLRATCSSLEGKEQILLRRLTLIYQFLLGSLSRVLNRVGDEELGELPAGFVVMKLGAEAS